MGNHHPPHFLLDDSWYFITAATYQKGPFLQLYGHKSIVQESLERLSASFSIKLAAWVIMDNHYHLLLHAQTPEALKGFIQRLHGRTAYEINKNSDLKGRQIWHNYWDTIIRSDADFWTRFNYIHYNPVKHR
jgi:putative transposase